MNNDLNLKTIIPRTKAKLASSKRYSTTLFIFLVASIYLFILFQTNTLVNKQPDEASIKVDTAKSLKVNEDVVRQLKTLEDNSVNVQTLINDARNNPFQE